jgi:hypothetical protein
LQPEGFGSYGYWLDILETTAKQKKLNIDISESRVTAALFFCYFLVRKKNMPFYEERG